MAPPAKRRKRNVVHASDDEEEVRPQRNTLANFLFHSPDQHDAPRPVSTSPSPAPKKAPRPAASVSQPLQPVANQRRNAPRKASSKTEQPRSNGTSPAKRGGARSVVAKEKPEEKTQTADLKALFARQAERPSTAPPAKVDDITSDPISDDDQVGEHQAASSSRVGTNARKRFRGGTQGSVPPATAGGQKFLKPPRTQSDQCVNEDEKRTWSERFGPVNLEELAVHKRKVADVRRWLEDVMAGRMRQRLLILKGASGTGKTTTLRLLAKDMGCELLEWRNPTSTLGAGMSFQSASTQFEEFLGRGGKFGQLDTDVEAPTASDCTNGKSNDGARKIIVIEEFPNTFASSSGPLQSFRSTIMQYLIANTPSLTAFGKPPSKDPIAPVVMIISETLLTTTSASADSFTVHRLLGPEITRHPGTCIIEFNAIAPTLLASALERIVLKEARKSGRKRTPGPQVLKRLGEIGDIRSAISSLEFLCLKGDTATDWGAKVTFTKQTKAAKDSIALTQGERESLELVSRREASLGIFHAVGKVMYNKREEVPMGPQSPEGRAEVLPPYLAHNSRPTRSEISVDSLIDETGTDTHTFISSLHENYVLSCQPTGPSDASSSIDYINDCIDHLSDSDVLCPTSDIFFGGRGFGGGGFVGKDSASYVLRQDEITFHVATRGLLFSLPRPVKRIGTTSGRKGGDAFKMFYPTSLKLWREKEELESVVDHWSSRLLNGEETAAVQTSSLQSRAAAFRKPKPNNNNNSAEQQQRVVNKPAKEKQGDDAAQATPLLSLGSSARKEMLLERLPYMAHMARRRRSRLDGARLRDMEKVVAFSGLGGGGGVDEEAAAAEDVGDDVNGAEAWATDRPTEEGGWSPRRKAPGIRQKSEGAKGEGEGEGEGALPPVQQLFISDDDIEDD